MIFSQKCHTGKVHALPPALERMALPEESSTDSDSDFSYESDWNDVSDGNTPSDTSSDTFSYASNWDSDDNAADKMSDNFSMGEGEF